MKHKCVSLSHKKTLKVAFKARSRGKKKKRWLASCLQRLFTTRKIHKEEEEEDFLCSQTDISFNIVAHCGLIEEAFSGQTTARLISTTVSVFLHTHCYFFIYALWFKPALPCFTEQYTRGCSYHSLKKREEKNASRVQRFAYLFRITRWMLLQTPSRPLKHSARSSHFPLNHQTGPMLSWTLSAIFFYFLFYFIIMMFGLFIYLNNF